MHIAMTIYNNSRLIVYLITTMHSTSEVKASRSWAPHARDVQGHFVAETVWCKLQLSAKLCNVVRQWFAVCYLHYTAIHRKNDAWPVRESFLEIPNVLQSTNELILSCCTSENHLRNSSAELCMMATTKYSKLWDQICGQLKSHAVKLTHKSAELHAN